MAKRKGWKIIRDIFMDSIFIFFWLYVLFGNFTRKTNRHDLLLS